MHFDGVFRAVPEFGFEVTCHHERASISYSPQKEVIPVVSELVRVVSFYESVA